MRKYLVLLAFLSTTSTAEMTGREIALKMDEMDTSRDSKRSATMLIERGSKKLVRKLAMQNKKYGDDERSVIKFIEPVDVQDTQYLTWTYEAVEKDDDMWVYFPSDNLVRRISGGGKKGSFMRSDFANEDIGSRAVDDDVHELLGTEQLDGKSVYLVKSTPVPVKAADSSYAYRKLWVQKETFVAVKIEYFDRRERLVKRLVQGAIENIDGIWTATKLIMETPRKKSRTLMQYSDIRYNVNIEDSVFDQASLKR